MKSVRIKRRTAILLAFTLFFGISLALGAILGRTQPANAAPAPTPTQTSGGVAGPETCAACHKELVETWQSTRHANEAITCESCHGPFQPDHPGSSMPVTPAAELCSTCHKTTTEEWRASPHLATDTQCQVCHDSHSQTPPAATLTETQPANAASAPTTQTQTSGNYAGPDACAGCHKELFDTWQTTRHANAFSSPIFQRDWAEIGSDFTCLECHTTGYDIANSTYAHEGVTCESCHGPFQPGHPESSMPVRPDAELCSTCHKTTTDEWRASPHHAANIQCQACHSPHSQTPRAATVTELCTNCHKTMGDSFTHSTHAESGLQCSNCHMYTSPRSGDPIMGLVPTGHTFTVGSETCIGCHQDTVHTRDTIVKLTGQVEGVPEVDTETLKQQVAQQGMVIQELKGQSSVRLYTGLAQGAIVGLVTGVVAAWVVSRRIRVVEVDDE